MQELKENKRVIDKYQQNKDKYYGKRAEKEEKRERGGVRKE